MFTAVSTKFVSHKGKSERDISRLILCQIWIVIVRLSLFEVNIASRIKIVITIRAGGASLFDEMPFASFKQTVGYHYPEYLSTYSRKLLYFRGTPFLKNSCILCQGLIASDACANDFPENWSCDSRFSRGLERHLLKNIKNTILAKTNLLTSVYLGTPPTNVCEIDITCSITKASYYMLPWN